MRACVSASLLVLWLSASIFAQTPCATPSEAGVADEKRSSPEQPVKQFDMKSLLSVQEGDTTVSSPYLRFLQRSSPSARYPKKPCLTCVTPDYAIDGHLAQIPETSAAAPYMIPPAVRLCDCDAKDKYIKLLEDAHNVDLQLIAQYRSKMSQLTRTIAEKNETIKAQASDIVALTKRVRELERKLASVQSGQ